MDMARLLTMNGRQISKETFFDKIIHIWEIFSKTDKFTQMFIIFGIIFVVVTPLIISQKIGLFTFAGKSVYSNCVVPPQGFDEQELKMLSQSRHVNWCNTTLALNVNSGQQDNSQTTDQTGNSSSTNNGPFSIINTIFQQIIISIRKLFGK